MTRGEAEGSGGPHGSGKALCLGLMALLLLPGCDAGRKAKQSRAPEHRLAVAVTLPGTSGASHEILVAGVVKAIHEADLTARVGGQVEEIPVRLGQRVKKGQRLLLLSSQTFQARAIRSGAALSYARSSFARIDQLYRDGSAAKSEWDQAKQALDVATADDREALAQLSGTRVMAPFSGRISRRRVHKGDVVLPGTPLLSLVDTRQLIVVGHVPDTFSSSLHPGLGVRFSVRGRDLDAEIRDLSPQSDPVAHTVTVRALLKERSLERAWPSSGSGRFVQRVGTYGTLSIPVLQEVSMTLPVGAIIDHDGLREVFVVRSARAELRYVRTGRTVSGRVEILSGLAKDDMVVAHPPKELTDGRTVNAGPVQ